MIIQLNQTHHYGEQLEDVPQGDIEICPTWNGVSPESIISTESFCPGTILQRIKLLPWAPDRKWRWLYVRPQWCDPGRPDARSGSFWHMDVDAVYRSVAPTWDEFRAMAVSFGDVAETQFAEDDKCIEVGERPDSADYARLSGLLNYDWKTSGPRNAQVAHYTTLDVHRAGPIRRTGWRLIILAFATNAEPQEKWP